MECCADMPGNTVIAKRGGGHVLNSFLHVYVDAT